MISLGVKYLDDILGGGVEEGSSVAFVGSIEYDNVILMYQAVLEALREDKRVLVVDFRQPLSTLLKELKDHSMDYGTFLGKSLTVLDGYSNLYEPGGRGENVLPNPLDLGITTAIIKETLRKGEYDILAIDDIASQYVLHSDSKSYIRAIVRLVRSAKSLGKTVFVAVYADVFEKSHLAAVLLPFEYIIEVAGGVVEVRRSSHPIRVVEPRFSYTRTQMGIHLRKELYQSVEGIKSQLQEGEEGTLWLRDLIGQRVQVREEETEKRLIETIYDFLGPEDGKELLYTWGKKQFIGYGEYSKKHSTSVEDALEDLFKFTLASGGGKLELIEFSNSTVIIRGKHLFPGGKGYSYPLHPNYAGAFAQFLTEFTGERWEGEETLCEAMGAEHCEIVLKKVKKVK